MQRRIGPSYFLTESSSLQTEMLKTPQLFVVKAWLPSLVKLKCACEELDALNVEQDRCN